MELTPAEAREWRNAQSSFEQLREADRLVVSTPMWNFSMPYHLKQWIDRVMQSGWSFGMEPGKGYVPLLGGKKALSVCSCGGCLRYAGGCRNSTTAPVPALLGGIQRA